MGLTPAGRCLWQRSAQLALLVERLIETSDVRIGIIF
jgi:hypothetical protein